MPLHANADALAGSTVCFATGAKDDIDLCGFIERTRYYYCAPTGTRVAAGLWPSLKQCFIMEVADTWYQRLLR